MIRGPPRSTRTDTLLPATTLFRSVLPGMLGRSRLEPRDRHVVTELVDGTTRMRRACDILVDRFLTRDLDSRVRNALRLGAYQLPLLRTEERRGGKGCVCTCRSRWSPYH